MIRIVLSSSMSVHAGSRQSGAVLIMSMLMLLVMTLIGITTMNTATLEEKMSANSMNNNISLQASESAVDAALSDTNNLVLALNSSTPISVSTSLGVTGVTSVATIKYLGSTIAPGFSFGNNQGTFSTYQFEAEGTGSVPAANATSVTVQGIYRIGPGGS
ncbi:hypothetical protein MNBD_GAMMA12-3733 [hydrothermal vent metagenome]|uniref:Type 4 fimbrial biogenesis protein PilX N-terminal domain-containing protein n=1 Tax=hydrothermal vent metagenome TaxID=652676 RepID=A0A3B0Y2D6_9ZZZZ